MTDVPARPRAIPRPRGSLVLRLVLLVGLVVGARGLFDVGMGLWAHAWPTAEARVVSRGLMLRTTGRSSYSVDVGTYEYEVGGETHVGHAYAYDVRGWIDAPAKGSTVTVSYCPLAPDVAVMEPGLVIDHFLWLIVGGVIVLIATAPVRVWRRRREARARYAAAKEAARARRG